MNHFICPHCRESLKLENRSLVCSNRHSFDLAGEGYVNLLPVNAKKTRAPGDNAKMMMARRDFLNAGHYAPLAERIGNLISDLTEGQSAKILDLGCGEGYYTGNIKQHNSALEMMGLDISKTAIRYASKKYRDIIFCVASSYDIPVGNDSLDIIIRIYAPSLEKELSRTIKSEGYLITVTPGGSHLLQLRQMIYTEVFDHSEDVPSMDNFTHEKRINITYTMNLQNRESVKNLLVMTPFGWKISEENEKKLLEKNVWEIDCDFNIDIFKKH